MPVRKLIAIPMAVLAILFSPALIVGGFIMAGIIFLFVAVPLCPVMTAKVSGDCHGCHSELCPFLVALVMFVIVPSILVAMKLKKSKNRK